MNELKLTYFEVEALLRIIADVEDDYSANSVPLKDIEISAREKLKLIYAAQIKSHNAKIKERHATNSKP